MSISVGKVHTEYKVYETAKQHALLLHRLHQDYGGACAVALAWACKTRSLE